jgi:hypothetical protein
MNAPDVEINKMTGRAGGCATSASHTTDDGWLGLKQVIPDRFIIFIIIDLTVRIDGIAEGFQGLLY